MVEYGGVVQTGGGSGPGGSGLSGGSDVMGIVSDIIERIAAQPPEILLIVAAIIAVGGLFVIRRSF